MTRKDIFGLIKRFLLTFLCCVPVLLVIGYFLQGKVQSWIMVTIFVVVAGAVLAIEEYIVYTRRKKREKIKQELKSKHNKKQ